MSGRISGQTFETSFRISFFGNFTQQKGDAKTSFGLSRKQKIGAKQFWAQQSELGEECRVFWVRIVCGGLKPWRNKVQNFEGRVRWEISGQLF